MRPITFFKYFLFIIIFFCVIANVKAQATYLCNESFSSITPQGWSIQPTYSATAPSWKTDTGIVVSAKYAMHGYIPVSTGDTAELVTPFFDCSNYPHVLLRFSHICKVLPSDICEIQYQEQGLGTNYKWKAIPWDAYQGNCTLYKTDLNFSHASYSDWKVNDTFAKPNSGWFKEETFDLSDYASYSKVRFRFIIRKGAYFGSFIASGWYVDDFQVFASQNIMPIVEFITNPNDTVYSTGPFKIKAKVASRTISKIIQPYLSYSVTYKGNTQKDSIKMTAVTGDSIWEADIPQQHYESEVNYSIFAHDSFGNSAIANAKFYICYLSHDSLLKDTYTVGKGNSYDFPTLSDAFYILDKYGMGGDVTLQLASGTYAERIVINGFNITNKLHITISSLANNADSVLFRPNTGPVVSLANCAGLTFRNLTFDARKVCNICVHLVSGLKHIEFNHCKLYGFDTAVYSNAYANSGVALGFCL